MRFLYSSEYLLQVVDLREILQPRRGRHRHAGRHQQRQGGRPHEVGGKVLSLLKKNKNRRSYLEPG